METTFSNIELTQEKIMILVKAAKGILDAHEFHS